MTTERTIPPTDLALVFALAVLGALLRLYRLETGLWFDEIVTVLDSVRLPLGTILTHFPSNNDHPLYSVLAHLSVSALGESPWTLRLPSALLGVATIPLLYYVGILVATRMEALAAAAILTVSYHHIWFSQNARGYTTLLFFVLLSTLGLVKWFETGRRGPLVLYAAATALGAYAHLTMVLVCLSHTLVCAFEWMSGGSASRVRTDFRSIAGAFVGAGVLTVLLYAPMVADVGTFFTTKTAAANEVATPVWALIAAVRGMQVGFGAAWGIGLGAIVFAAGVWGYLRHTPVVGLLFLLPLPVTVALALALDRPIFPRFVFFAVGFALLVTVRGGVVAGEVAARILPSALTPQRARGAVVGMLTVAAVAMSLRSLPYGYRYPKQDYVQAVAFVERTKAPDDVVAAVTETSATPVLKYLARPWRRVDDAGQLRQLTDQGGPVWVIYTLPSYIEAGQPDLWELLQRSCTAVGEFEGTVAGGTISVRRC